MDAETIQLAKINTKDNLADPITESLVRQDHSRLISTTMGTPNPVTARLAAKK